MDYYLTSELCFQQLSMCLQESGFHHASDRSPARLGVGCALQLRYDFPKAQYQDVALVFSVHADVKTGVMGHEAEAQLVGDDRFGPEIFALLVGGDEEHGG